MKRERGKKDDNEVEGEALVEENEEEGEGGERRKKRNRKNRI